MRLRAPITLAVALGLASVSVHLARVWIAEQAGQGSLATQPQAAPVPVTQIVVAAEPLPYGSKVVRAKLRLAVWPAESVPQGAFTSLDEVVGGAGPGTDDRLVLRAIVRDEPILKHKISGFGARASLSALIAPGQRAATIRVNDVNGVAGFVLPGDRVDVLLTRDAGGGSARRDLVTDVLLQDMKVLGIDQDANAEREKPAVVRAVTLEVTQQEAQKLTLAQKLGTLSLTLRHASALDAHAPLTITARDLPLADPPAADKIMLEADNSARPGGRHEPPAASETPQARTAVSPIRIVRGLEVSVYDVAIESTSTRARPSAIVEAPSFPGVWAPSAAAPIPHRRLQPPLPGAQLEAASPLQLVPHVATGAAIPIPVPRYGDLPVAPRRRGENG